MDGNFGPESISSINQSSVASSSGAGGHIYTAEEISLMLAALGAMIASIVYSVKNIKHSSCLAGVCECDQITELRELRSRRSTTATTHNLTLDPAATATIV